MSTVKESEAGATPRKHPVPQRAAAVVLGAGIALFGAGTLLHPPTVRREDLMHVILEGTSSKWLGDHWLLALASALIAVGLAGFHAALARRPGGLGTAALAAPLGAVSAAFWTGLFVFEASAWPALAEAVAAGGGQSSPLLPVAQGVWNASLALGYAGGVLFAAAVGLWSLDLAAAGEQGGTLGFARLGLAAAIYGAFAQALAWAAPAAALYLLIPAAALFGWWLLLAVLRLWRRSL